MLRDILDAVAGEVPAWDEMAPRLDQRMARYAQLLERLIGPDGTFPPLGRSIIYRGAAFQPLAQLALRKQLPPALTAGQVRAALGAVVNATLSEASLDERGWLRIGLCGDQPTMAERYISTDSLYLCSTIFLPLGLPENDRYWTDELGPGLRRKSGPRAQTCRRTSASTAEQAARRARSCCAAAMALYRPKSVPGKI